MTLEEIGAAIRAHLDANPADGGDKGAIVKMLRADFAVEIGNPLIGIGAAKGKGEVERTTVKELTTKVEELTSESERKDAQIAAYEKKVPEIETVRAEHTAQLKARDAKHAEALAKKDEEVTKAARSRERARIESELKGKVPDFAIESLADKAEKRIRPNADGSVDLLGEDGVSIGQTTDPEAMKTFVKSALKGVAKEMLLVDGDSGSDFRQGAGGGGGGGSGKIIETGVGLKGGRVKVRDSEAAEIAAAQRSRSGVPSI